MLAVMVVWCGGGGVPRFPHPHKQLRALVPVHFGANKFLPFSFFSLSEGGSVLFGAKSMLFLFPERPVPNRGTEMVSNGTTGRRGTVLNPSYLVNFRRFQRRKQLG